MILPISAHGFDGAEATNQITSPKIQMSNGSDAMSMAQRSASYLSEVEASCLVNAASIRWKVFTRPAAPFHPQVREPA